MVSQKITIKNPSGLHARPASILAQAAGKCSSNVIIVYGEKRIQVKSILNIMAAAIKCGNGSGASMYRGDRRRRFKDTGYFD